MIDASFGNWLAGFIDGEGCFFIANDSSRGVYRPRFSIALRVDDEPIIQEIKTRTGIGTIHRYTASSTNRLCIRWMLQAQKDCEELVKILEEHPLRAKKRSDFETWKLCVELGKKIRMGCKADNLNIYVEMKALKEQMTIDRNGAYDVYVTN